LATALYEAPPPFCVGLPDQLEQLLAFASAARLPLPAGPALPGKGSGLSGFAGLVGIDRGERAPPDTPSQPKSCSQSWISRQGEAADITISLKCYGAFTAPTARRGDEENS
jgi:hypothetical protein